MCAVQDFVEDTDTTGMAAFGRQVDVRDIGTAHVLAAEVILPSSVSEQCKVRDLCMFES